MDGAGVRQCDIIKCVIAQMYIKQVLEELLPQLSWTSWRSTDSEVVLAGPDQLSGPYAFAENGGFYTTLLARIGGIRRFRNPVRKDEGLIAVKIRRRAQEATTYQLRRFIYGSTDGGRDLEVVVVYMPIAQQLAELVSSRFAGRGADAQGRYREVKRHYNDQYELFKEAIREYAARIEQDWLGTARASLSVHFLS